eukprot:CAMPEP_0170895220 /NCGR_PEP_ID=MMETSP0734-20130129/43785_1 /TAXON_ID=186038 /ORGANISM="Fragilariopsis kerguelensis, Strain L26-C5" /LENGTH=89 /DNA_ID=CAMNT_0011286661 /DNA_START=627 /DNA_END=893 /DNA_ORIENTATION=-
MAKVGSSPSFRTCADRARISWTSRHPNCGLASNIRATTPDIMGAAKEVPSPASAHFPLFTAAITVVCACFGSPPGPEIKTEAPLVLKEE